jgi:hypothetical protein
MPDDPDNLRPATPGELAEALRFALMYEGRKRRHDGDRLAANIVAQRLARHLERSGFVVMKRPPAPMHTASDHPHPHRGE